MAGLLAAMNFEKEPLRQETAQWGKHLTHLYEVLRLNLQNPRKMEGYRTPGYPTLCQRRRTVEREHPKIISSVSTMANDKNSCLRQGRK